VPAKSVKLTTLSCDELAKLVEIPAFRDVAIGAMKVKGCPVVKK
jgi:hypothetical protein